MAKKTKSNRAEAVVKALLIGKGADATGEDSISSQQLAESDWMKAHGEYFAPPYDPLVWAQTLELNTRLSKAISTYARNTVGIGWMIVPLVDINDETPEEIKEKVKEQTATAKKLFSRPSNLKPFTTIMFLVKSDEESTGNGYLEIVRNNGGKIVRLNHVPSTTMRVRKKGGYIQIRGQRKRYFKVVGDDRVVSAKTGKEGKFPYVDRATEILQFMIYTSSSSYYGAPRFVAAAPAISGNRLSALRNVRFFENDAVPRLIISVSGGKLSASTVESVRNFLQKEGKGVPNAHRVLVLQAETKRLMSSEAKTNIDITPLTVGLKEDASFMAYRKANDEEIRESFGIGKAFFTMEDVNKASGAISRQITNEQEFDPDRLEKEYIVNSVILDDLLGEDRLVKLKFKRPMRAEPLEAAEIEEKYSKMGALTPNEVRIANGLSPYPSSYAFANKPFTLAVIELQMGVALAIQTAKEKMTPEKKDKANELIDQLIGVRSELHKKIEAAVASGVDVNPFEVTRSFLDSEEIDATVS